MVIFRAEHRNLHLHSTLCYAHFYSTPRYLRHCHLEEIYYLDTHSSWCHRYSEQRGTVQLTWQLRRDSHRILSILKRFFMSSICLFSLKAYDLSYRFFMSLIINSYSFGAWSWRMSSKKCLHFRYSTASAKLMSGLLILSGKEHIRYILLAFRFPIRRNEQTCWSFYNISGQHIRFHSSI